MGRLANVLICVSHTIGLITFKGHIKIRDQMIDGHNGYSFELMYNYVAKYQMLQIAANKS